MCLLHQLTSDKHRTAITLTRFGNMDTDILTARLHLRPLHLDDAEALMTINSFEEIRKQMLVI
jgi:hypothetical protein